MKLLLLGLLIYAVYQFILNYDKIRKLWVTELWNVTVFCYNENGTRFVIYEAGWFNDPLCARAAGQNVMFFLENLSPKQSFTFQVDKVDGLL